jgi:hypothetical protein
MTNALHALVVLQVVGNEEGEGFQSLWFVVFGLGFRVMSYGLSVTTGKVIHRGERENAEATQREPDVGITLRNLMFLMFSAVNNPYRITHNS